MIPYGDADRKPVSQTGYVSGSFRISYAARHRRGHDVLVLVVRTSNNFFEPLAVNCARSSTVAMNVLSQCRCYTTYTCVCCGNGDELSRNGSKATVTELCEEEALENESSTSTADIIQKYPSSKSASFCRLFPGTVCDAVMRGCAAASPFANP